MNPASTRTAAEGRGGASDGASRAHRVHTRAYLGEEFSLFRVLRWKSEGAKHTARLVGVIWFSFTAAVTSLKK